MKAIYDFLQTKTAIFGSCVLFASSPNTPVFLQKYESLETAADYAWTLTIVSIIMFTLCFWWAKADWGVKKPGYMMVHTFGSLLGILIGVSALIGMHGYGTFFYQLWRGLPATILTCIMFGAAAIQMLFGPDENEGKRKHS